MKVTGSYYAGGEVWHFRDYGNNCTGWYHVFPIWRRPPIVTFK